MPRVTLADDAVPRAADPRCGAAAQVAIARRATARLFFAFALATFVVFFAGVILGLTG
ncbi:MAG: hypothetical protein KatS3mg052_2307 [Candidatus Roseilinea sp.]|nr:MAG: hypothetical protein KatS3mg052_2307 [Candidatus Roseilinea sp.]